MKLSFRKFNTSTLLATMICLCVSVLPTTAYTQSQTFENFEKSFPETGYFTEDELLQNTKFIENMDPYNDPYSSFMIFIPEDFVTTPPENIKNVKKNGKLSGTIANYHDDVFSGLESKITVEAHELKFNVTARNWLVSHLMDYGYSIEGIREHTPDKAEALGSLFDKEDGDYRTRIMAYKNGARILLVKYSIPIRKWEQSKRLQASVVKTFKPLKEDDAQLVSLVDYDFMGFVNIEYPETWNFIGGKSSNYDRPYFRLTNTRTVPGTSDKVNIGIINFNLILQNNIDTSLIDEGERVKKQINQMGFRIGEKIPQDYNLSYPENATIKSFELYNLTNKKDENDDFQLWLTSIKGAEYMYIISMITPNKARDFKAWIENKSTYEQLVASIEPIVYER